MTHKCSRMLSRPKRHILGRKHALWRIDRADRSRNATWVRAKKAKRKRKETQRCDKSPICRDHPRCATPTKVVMWGGVPDVVNHANFIKIGLGVLAPRGVEICHFPILSAMAYITG